MPKKTKTTTIAVEVKVQKILEGLKRGRDDYNDVIKRLLGESQGEIYAEFILVDNELAQLHTCVFQLGEDKDALFFFDGQFIKPITLEETNKLMKQPKPNISFNVKEAGFLQYALLRCARAGKHKSLEQRIAKFLGTKEGDLPSIEGIAD